MLEVGGHKDQIGRNDSLEQYLKRLNRVWQEVARTLLPDGKVALKIGKITMQRKGSDAGRETAKMLQFKINSIELFKENK